MAERGGIFYRDSDAAYICNVVLFIGKDALL